MMYSGGQGERATYDYVNGVARGEGEGKYVGAGDNVGALLLDEAQERKPLSIRSGAESFSVKSGCICPAG
jgi:hypothetical protein